ncbi:MAG TPA: DUF1330 domain-containing protein [Ilumatobacter sp.]|nr:DUF1330 domain-containing protein [Ilumatobacter sp.]
MAAYVIYQGQVLDAKRYDEYKTKGAASILSAGGRFLVRGGDVEVLEGEAPAGRTVLLEFPTMQAALNWYRSNDTAIRKIRDGAARRTYVRRRRHRLKSPSRLHSYRPQRLGDAH